MDTVLYPGPDLTTLQDPHQTVCHCWGHIRCRSETKGSPHNWHHSILGLANAGLHCEQGHACMHYAGLLWPSVCPGHTWSLPLLRTWSTTKYLSEHCVGGILSLMLWPTCVLVLTDPLWGETSLAGSALKWTNRVLPPDCLTHQGDQLPLCFSGDVDNNRVLSNRAKVDGASLREHLKSNAKTISKTPHHQETNSLSGCLSKYFQLGAWRNRLTTSFISCLLLQPPLEAASRASRCSV